MAKIDKVDLGAPPQVGASISPATASQASIAAAQESANIQKMGQDFFNEAKEASDNASYAAAITSASASLNERIQERISQRTDEEGNPTFDRMPSDIANISKEVQREALAGISSPEVRTRFEVAFANQSVKSQALALKHSRSQQVDFARAGSRDALESIRDQIRTAEPEMMDSLMGQAADIMQTGVSSGAFTAQESQQVLANLNEEATFEKVLDEVRANPEAVLAELDDGATFGLSRSNVDKMHRRAEAGAKDNARQAKIAEQQAMAVQERQQNHNEAELEKSIIQGDTSESALVEAFNNDEITLEQFDSLDIKRIRKYEAQQKEELSMSTIRDDIKEGRSLVDHTPAMINKEFTQRVKELDDQSITSIATKVAGPMQGDVPLFRKRLADNLKFGSDQDAADTIAAVEYLRKVNPRSVEKMDKDSLALYGKASLSMAAGIEPAEAMRQAREAIDPAKKRDIEFLEKAFANEEGNNIKNIRSFVKDALGDAGLLDFTEPDSVDVGVMTRAQGLIEQAYIKNDGDLEAAYEAVKVQLSGFAAETSFNGGSTVSIKPPEFMYPNVPAHVLRRDLVDSLQERYPNIPEDKLEVHFDELTQAYLVIADKTPLQDEKGLPVTWNYGAEHYRQNIQDNNEARFLQQKEALKSTAGLTAWLRSRNDEGAGALADMIEGVIKNSTRTPRDKAEDKAMSDQGKEFLKDLNKRGL
jgi:hypothetical protein